MRCVEKKNWVTWVVNDQIDLNFGFTSVPGRSPDWVPFHIHYQMYISVYFITKNSQKEPFLNKNGKFYDLRL